jgi:tetratricopeptide (TPR) repeat protein
MKGLTVAVLTISKEIECEDCHCALEVNSGVITCPNCNSSWPLPKKLWDALTTGRVKIEHKQHNSEDSNKHCNTYHEDEINTGEKAAPLVIPPKKRFLWWLVPGQCVHCGSELSRLFKCRSCHKLNRNKVLITYFIIPLVTLSSAVYVNYVKPATFLRILGDYETLNERGLAQALNSNYSKAIEYYNTALKINPHLYEAILNRGDAYDNKGSHDQAIADFNTVLNSRPKDDRALNGRGNAQRNKGNYDKAIADFDAAIKIRPDNHIYLTNRGNAHRSKGNYDKAIADFDAAIKMRPDDFRALNSRGDAYRSKGDYERATADYVVALRVDSSRAGDERNSEAVRSKKRKR